MEVVRGIAALSHSVPHPVLTIGNFDGVHVGHQKIISLAVEKAKAREGQCVAYTFRPHPQVALRPALPLYLLSTYDEKLERLAKLGVDLVIEEPFSREFSSIEPEQFFTDVILRGLGAEAIVVGYDFAFGKGRHGHLENLEKFCKKAGVDLTVVPPQRLGNNVVSSSKIRQYLLAGDVETAGQLLGHTFSYQGVIIKGEGRGNQLGFPTANVQLENKLTLPYGVYATWAQLNGKLFPSVTNVGVRPTFHENGEPTALVETHLLDSHLDLYGRIVTIQFVSRLRDEKKFSSITELKQQIQEDVAQARQILQATPSSSSAV